MTKDSPTKKLPDLLTEIYGDPGPQRIVDAIGGLIQEAIDYGYQKCDAEYERAAMDIVPPNDYGQGVSTDAALLLTQPTELLANVVSKDTYDILLAAFRHDWVNRLALAASFQAALDSFFPEVDDSTSAVAFIRDKFEKTIDELKQIHGKNYSLSNDK